MIICSWDLYRISRVGILIIILSVVFTCHTWDPGRRDFSILNQVPVNPSEPLMLLDIGRPVLSIAESFIRVYLQKMLDQVLGFRLNIRGELKVALNDLLVDLPWILIVEGWVPS